MFLKKFDKKVNLKKKSADNNKSLKNYPACRVKKLMHFFSGEATRLLAWIVKNSRSEEVMRLIIRSDGIPFLVGMATSEHVVMQNESLVSLTLIATSVLGKEIYCFFLKSVHYVNSLCNTFNSIAMETIMLK